MSKTVKILLCCSVFAAAAYGQQQQGITIHPIKEGRVYWAEGGGGNSGVIIGTNGVIVIDAKTTPESGKQLVAEIAKLTPKPITRIILTHSDCDHVNGLPGFPEGVPVLAHENNLMEQQTTLQIAQVEVGGGRGLPPVDRMPTQVVLGEKAVTKIEGINLVLYHFAPAHTNGDLVVYLPDDKVVFTGDIITTTVLVHPEKNGTLDGWFKTARAMLALDADTFVGGHASGLDTKATVQKKIDQYQAMRDKITAMRKEGKSRAEIKSAMGDPAVNRGGCRGIPFPTFTDTEYQFQANRGLGINQ